MFASSTQHQDSSWRRDSRRQDSQGFLGNHPAARGGHQVAHGNFPPAQLGNAVHRAVGRDDDHRPESGADAAAMGGSGKRLQPGAAAVQDWGRILRVTGSH